MGEPVRQQQGQQTPTATRQQRTPILRPGYTSGSVTDKISAIVLTQRTPRGWFIGFGVAFALVMVLTVPAAWMHYEALLFLPFAALLLHAREHPLGLTRTALLAISGYDQEIEDPDDDQPDDRWTERQFPRNDEVLARLMDHVSAPAEAFDALLQTVEKHHVATTA